MASEFGGITAILGNKVKDDKASLFLKWPLNWEGLRRGEFLISPFSFFLKWPLNWEGLRLMHFFQGIVRVVLLEMASEFGGITTLLPKVRCHR